MQFIIFFNVKNEILSEMYRVKCTYFTFVLQITGKMFNESAFTAVVPIIAYCVIHMLYKIYDKDNKTVFIQECCDQLKQAI